MKVDIKKLLLAGTAVIAVGAFAQQAQAADEFVIDTNESGTFTTAAPDETADTAFDFGTNVNALSSQSKNVRVDNTGTINVSNGDIIGSSVTGTAIIANANAKTLTLADATTDNAADSVVINGDISKGAQAQLNVTIKGNAQDATPDVLNLDINGNIDLGTGTLTVDSDTNAGNAMNINLSGNLTAAATVLQDDGAPITLTFDGTTAQAVSGTLDGQTDADGTIVIANAAGVTFNGAIGGTQGMDLITVSKTGANSAVTFKANVKATAIVLGDGLGSGTNTMTVNSAGGDVTVTGTVNGTANDTDVLAINGAANKAVFASAIGGTTALDSITVATASTAQFNDNVKATAVTLTGTGAFNTGTTDGKTITANINPASAGAGSVLINADTTLVGNVGAVKTLTMGAGDVLTVDANTLNANATVAAQTIVLTDATAGITFAQGSKSVTVSNDITALVDGAGALVIGDGTGAINFNGDVGQSTAKSLASLTVTNGAGVQAINAAGDVFVDAVALGTSDTLNLLGASGTVSGTVDGNGADGRGAVVVGSADQNSTYTFSSKIGNTADLAGFKVSLGSTANLSQNLEVSSATAGALNFDGTVNVDTTANTVLIDNTSTGAFALDGTLVVDGTANTNALTLGSGGEIHAGWNDTEAKLVAGRQVILTDDFEVGDSAGDMYSVLIRRDAQFNPTATAVIAAGANAVDIDAGSKLYVGLDSGSTNFANGDLITVIDASVNAQRDNIDTAYASLITQGNLVLQDGLVSLVNNGSDGQDLKVKVVYNDAEDVLSSANAVGAANRLMGLPAATGELGAARSELMSAATAEEANTIAESLAPIVDGGVAAGALNVAGRVNGLTSDRMASLRDGSASGIAAGNAAHGLRGWIQAFGQTATQDREDGVDGYDADTYGVAVGADGETVSGGNVGVALSYGNTDVDHEAGNGAESEVDSYQISVYGDMPVADRTYIEGMVGYAWNDIESTRFNVANSGLNADADYDAHQITAYAELGRDFAQGNGLTLTPHVNAHYTYFNADNYSETGAGGLNLEDVDPDALHKLDLGVGVDAVWDVRNSDGSGLKPALSAGVAYDLIGDDVETSARFAGAGAAFDTQGLEPSRTSLNLGAGVTYYTVDNWELSAEYDFQYKSDYDAHSGLLRAGFHF